MFETACPICKESKLHPTKAVYLCGYSGRYNDGILVTVTQCSKMIKNILRDWLCRRNDLHETDRFLLRAQAMAYLINQAIAGIFEEIPNGVGTNTDTYRYNLRILFAPIIEDVFHHYGLTEKLTLEIADRDFPAPIVQAFRDYGIFER